MIELDDLVPGWRELASIQVAVALGRLMPKGYRPDWDACGVILMEETCWPLGDRLVVGEQLAAYFAGVCRCGHAEYRHVPDDDEPWSTAAAERCGVPHCSCTEWQAHLVGRRRIVDTAEL